mmetsp:Transcript_14407/g.20296  ORF Transcript_14407/g.20296 Transcript_14407/m.20296 type:complete len:618 (+) Transcript_14407:123-1976(+)
MTPTAFKISRLLPFGRIRPNGEYERISLKACRSSSTLSSSLRNSRCVELKTCFSQRSIPQIGWRTRCIRAVSSFSPREMAALEERLITYVGLQVKDPVLQKDLRTLGWIQKRIVFSDNSLRIELRLPTFLHPALQELKECIEIKAREELERISFEKGWKSPPQVNLHVVATQPHPVVAREVEEHTELISRLGPGLANVAHFVAVYSCKGGVGKSTVAANLAYELAQMSPGRVGLLDVDIYGPSLPVLIKPKDPAVRKSPKGQGMVYPIEHEGVKIISLGYVSPNSGVPGSGPNGGAAVMRGPMAGRVVSQLLKGTDWGDLDVMVLDLPPGTGDVQLEICQNLQLSGAVAVTTPSKMAATDARKGIEMFTSLGVQTLAAVENMAYFDCEGGGRHYPFGRGIRDLSKLENDDLDFKSSNVFQLPISTRTNEANDCGAPICLARPDDAKDELAVFEQLAKSVSKELLLIQNGVSSENISGLGSPHTVTFAGGSEEFDVATIHLSIDSEKDAFTVRLFSEKGATQVTIPGKDLRFRHPKTGEKMDQQSNAQDSKASESISHEDSMVDHYKHDSKTNQLPTLFPATIDKKGRYGYSVEWADGATIIYSMLSLAKAAGGEVKV